MEIGRDQSPKGVHRACEVRDEVDKGMSEARIGKGEVKVILRLRIIEYTGVVLIYL